MDANNHPAGMHNPYLQYQHNTTFDPNEFFNEAQEYVSNNNDPQPDYDPALFDIPTDLANFQQPQQSAQPNNQNSIDQRSQSPALQQYQNQNLFPPQQYGQNIYDPGLAQSAFNPTLMSRQSHSPSQFVYQQNMNYGQQQFDPQFNAFQPQHQSRPASTPTPPQPFRPQATQQNAQMYMNAPRPTSQVQQPQNGQAMQYSFLQAPQNSQYSIDPSMLDPTAHQYANSSNNGRTQSIDNAAYFAKLNGGQNIDPRMSQMQYTDPAMLQMRTAHNGQIQNQMMGITPQQQAAMQSVLQFSAQPAKPKDVAPAPKRPRGRPRKDGGKPSSASSSDDDLEIEDEPPEEKPAPLCLEKPSEPRGKLMYEIVEAVWSPRNKPAATEKIRSGLAVFGESIRSLRDMWKAQNEKLKKAELPNAPTAADASSLKADVAKYREVMEATMTRTLRYSHPSILRRLGEVPIAMSALYSFLLDRVTSDDYNSSLVVSILQLATKFETMDEDHLEKTKWTKILARFSKKSTNESRDFALKIISNAKKVTALKQSEGQGPPSPSGSSSGRAPGAVAGVKRVRDDRESIQQAMAKKATVRTSSKPLSVQLAEQKRLKERAAATAAGKDPKTGKPTNGAAPATATRTKVAAVAPVKSSPFALLSASKKPGTTMAERAAAMTKPPADTVADNKIESVSSAANAPIAAVVTKTEPEKVSSIPPKPPATSGASFLGFLTEMDKPKEAPVKKVETDPNETPEQRAKRLRKEARRRLRVTWRPDNELTQVKYFEHDLEEDTGHDNSMMRDVGDTAKEGEMLKRHVNVEEDEEEEEDEDRYELPTEVDFEPMDKEQRESNFAKTGGPNVAESRSSTAQNQHEEGKLMTMYTSRDQPETPQEAPNDDDDDENFDPVVDFGEPSDPKVRSREQRLIERKNQMLQQRQPTQAMPANLDLSQLLSSMQGVQQQPQAQAQNNWMSQLGLFGQQQPQPQTTQPQAATGAIDFQKLLAVAGQYSQMQQQQQQPAYQPQTPASVAPQTNANPQLAALLASFSQQQQQQQQGQPQINSLVSNTLSLGNGANPNPFPGNNDDLAGGKKDKKRNKTRLGVDGKPLNYKTQVCSFWLEGKCMKGDACTYRHDEG